ncbi:MAG: peroxiredoxin family protein [Thermoplasmata archaeon]
MKKLALTAVVLLALGSLLLFLQDFYISEGVATDFTVVDIDGNSFTLSEQRGKVVLLEFMTTTCDVCKAVTENLKTTREVYSESELLIISISISPADNDILLRDYRDTYQANWIFAMARQDLRLSYEARSVPLLYFIDGRGRIASIYLGYLDTGQISGRIDQAMSMTDPMRMVVLPVISLSLVGAALGSFLFIGYRNREQIKRQLFGDSRNS